MTDRRAFLHSTLLTLAGSSVTRPWIFRPNDAPSAASQDPYELRIQPTRVFARSPDANRSQVEGWSFTLAVVSSQATAGTLESLVFDYQSNGTTQAEVRYPASALSSINLFAGQPAPGRAPFPLFGTIVTETLPIALAVDTVHVTVRLRNATGTPAQLQRRIPIERFTQQTALIFPFRGRGMITQGGVLNDGHRNRSGMFAVDAIGLSELYAAMNDSADTLASYAGWGRTIIAPAAGTIVSVRNDRPDQPVPGTSDARYFSPDFPAGGDPANHVVIDHGNGEFSMIAHMQAGSVHVKAGDRVEQGTTLGLLGNSGDSTSPHVHHQLMSGPQWTTADALPHVYSNGPGSNHDRGAIFNAK